MDVLSRICRPIAACPLQKASDVNKANSVKAKAKAKA